MKALMNDNLELSQSQWA